MTLSSSRRSDVIKSLQVAMLSPCASPGCPCPVTVGQAPKNRYFPAQRFEHLPRACSTAVRADGSAPFPEGGTMEFANDHETTTYTMLRQILQNHCATYSLALPHALEGCGRLLALVCAQCDDDMGRV